MQLTKFNCLRCKADMEVELPELKKLEDDMFSQLMWVHQEPYKCFNCGQAHTMFIGNLGGVAIGMRAIESKTDSKIITLPNGMTM